MLSRIAEGLYWIGRYTERAEDTTRLLDVSSRAVLESGQALPLAALLGGTPPAGGDPAGELVRYCLDRSVPESVASAVSQARENARQIREAVTSDLWEVLNAWHLTLAASTPAELAGPGAASFLTAMKNRAFLFGGALHSTLPRSEGWQWLTVGRYLERLAFTTRLLDLRAGDLAGAGDAPPPVGGAASYDLVVLLRALSAYDSYRMAYSAVVEPHRVAQFLLFDPASPRSARFCAARIADATAQVAEGEYGQRARRLAGRLHAALEYGQVADLAAGGVGDFVASLRSLAAGVHEALGDDQFARAGLQPAHALDPGTVAG